MGLPWDGFPRWQRQLFAVLCSYEANFSMKFDQSTAGVAAVLFQKTQRLPSASLGSDMKQMDELKPGEQPLVSKKPNAAWHSDELREYNQRADAVPA
eukprot:Skav222433  [mRNA]  locus=scaffold2883:35978:37736:- [translate_table: standard]